MTVTIATNRFEDCEHIFALDGAPLLTLRISDRQALISLSLPRIGNVGPIHVLDNTVIEGPVSVDAMKGTEAIARSNGATVVNASVTGPDTMQVDLDLRSLGLNIYSEEAILHVGAAILSGNLIQASQVAINLERQLRCTSPAPPAKHIS